MAKLTLKDVAQEMNKVMAYGVDPETGKVVDEKEMIDVDMRDKALEAEIIKRCVEDGDLRESDKPDFSADVWDWFLDHGCLPDAKADKKEDKKGGKSGGGKKDKDDKKEDKGRERGRDRERDDDRGSKDKDRDDSRDRGRERDRDDDKGRGRDRDDDRDNDRGRDRDRDSRDDRRDDRDNDRGRDREQDRETRSRAAKSESYVSAAFRIATDSVKNKTKKADLVYDMFKGLQPLFEEAGVRDKKYMLERACHYTIEMHGKVNVGSAKELFKDNEDLLEEKKGR